MDIVARCSLPSGAAKLLERIMRGHSDANIPFDKLRSLLRDLGFQERVKGSHHVFCATGLARPLNLQPATGGKCKPYEVRQVRRQLGALLSADTKLAAA